MRHLMDQHPVGLKLCATDLAPDVYADEGVGIGGGLPAAHAVTTFGDDVHARAARVGVDLAAVPERPHWQPTAYNPLHGSLQRWFEPIEPVLCASPAWRQLLRSLGELFAELRPDARWYIEAHQFHIDTAGGIGRRRQRARITRVRCVGFQEP